jgi:hypothetical protein
MHPPAGARAFSQRRSRPTFALPALTALSPATSKSTPIANGCQPAPHPLGLRGDLLWAFPLWRREIHERPKVHSLRDGYSGVEGWATTPSPRQ